MASDLTNKMALSTSAKVGGCQPIRYAWAAMGMRPSETDFGPTRYVSEHEFDRITRVLSDKVMALEVHLRSAKVLLGRCGQYVHYRSDVAEALHDDRDGELYMDGAQYDIMEECAALLADIAKFREEAK